MAIPKILCHADSGFLGVLERAVPIHIPVPPIPDPRQLFFRKWLLW